MKTLIDMISDVMSSITTWIEHLVRRREISQQIVWEYMGHKYSPLTKQYEEKLSLIVKNLLTEPVKVNGIEYICPNVGKNIYSYPKPYICESNTEIELPLFPNIPDIFNIQYFCVITIDNKGYKHKTKFEIQKKVNEYNVDIKFIG